MSNEKTIKARQIQKHDIEANWLKAVNFVPKDGEIIIYDAETAAPTADEAAILGRNYAIPYVRIKIGNGKDSVISLSFIPYSTIQMITWEEDD